MRRIKYIILSILSLANIMLVPSFVVWEGLIPSKYENTFFEVVKDVFADSDAIHHWSVIIVLSVLIPSVLMLISAALDKKVLYSASSALGIILWVRIAISYIRQYDIGDFFDFDDGSLSIGFWIALIIFIIALIVRIISKNDYSENHAVKNKKFAVETNNSVNQVMIEKGSFCPNCGSKIDKQSIFCGNCGYKF